jgi:uncharacterized protein involved in outer membrane biogenesis
VQTTLLGIAVALILALVAALVGPHFVNWNDYRAQFEAEAGKLVGLDVRVAGPIDVRLLPTPSVKLGAIEIGPAGEASRLRARSLGVELQLGSLMRGEIRAGELRLSGPEFGIGLNSLGQVDWPAMTLPAGESVAIERLTVEDGRIVLTDARSQSRAVLENIGFTGEVRSLLGPVRGEGAFVSGGRLYGYKLSANRLTDEGLRLRLSFDTAERPFNLDAEGLLAFERGAPRFDGQLTASRPAGAVLASGRALMAEPLRMATRVSVRSDAVLFDTVEVHYGAEERGLHFTGAAELKLGERPRMHGVLSARQIDLDRLIATTDMPRRPPLAAVQAFSDQFGSALRPPVPVNLTIGVDALTVGGAVLQTFGTDLRSEGEGWLLDRMEFRAPGFTQVKLSGRLESQGTLGFAGSASVESNDPRTLVAWLAGTAPAGVQIKPWQIRGDVVAGAEGLSIERLRTTFERGTIEGRLAYRWAETARPARLEADLKAGEIDFDAMLAFANGALADTGFEPPREIVLALDVERARVAGFDARQVHARGTLESGKIAIERLTVADFGNAAIDASGQIETGARPGGAIALNLDARDLAGVIALAERFAPDVAEPIRTLAGRQSAAKLRATVSLEHAAADRAVGRLTMAGRIGAVNVDLSGSATGKPDVFSVTDLGALKATEARFEGRIDAQDGDALLTLFGLDRFPAGQAGAGQMRFAAAGPLNGALQVEGRLSVGPIDAEGKGVGRLAGDKPASLTLERIAGTLAGQKAQGRAAIVFSEPVRIDGALETELIDIPAAVAAFAGMRTAAKPQSKPQAKSGAKGWSGEPFRRSQSDLSGRLEFKAPNGSLMAGLPVQDLRGIARFGPGQLTFDDVQARVAGGQWSARLALTAGPEGLAARSRITLSDVDAAAILSRSSSPSPLTGRLNLDVEVEGVGLSPAAFVGSLSGQGSLAIRSGRVARLNPRAFEALLRAVDLGIATDNARVRDFMASALDTGSLPVERAEAKLAIAAGQVRLSNVGLRTPGADVTLSGVYSLADATVDATVGITGPAASTSMRPVVFVALRGPAEAPARTVDAAALTGWLALRAVEQQAKRIEELERVQADARRREAEMLREAEELRERERKRLEARDREAALERERQREAERLRELIAPPQPAPAPGKSDLGKSDLGDESPAQTAGDRVPPLPPPVTVPATPRPRPAATNLPMNLLGSQN